MLVGLVGRSFGVGRGGAVEVEGGGRTGFGGFGGYLQSFFLSICIVILIVY
jgi:hypothetical protein